MIRKYYVFNLVFLFFCSSASALNINIGISLVEGHYTDAQEEFGWSLDDISPNHDVLNRGYTNLGTGNIYYALYSDMQIRKFDVSTKQYLGNWPLSRWPYLNLPIELKTVYAEFIDENNIGTPSYSAIDQSIGCLNASPLRYGKLIPTSKPELILTLGMQLFIFSPEYNRVVFEEYIDHSDWLTEVESTKQRAEVRVDTDAQYLSKNFAVLETAEPAIRGYSKLFVGDFDEDSHVDILVWRKIYKSNLKDNLVKGFTLIRNEYQHYERDLTAQAKLPAGVTGEYLPQTTDTATIQTWLADKNLTWQKGYPSKSECAGQEGQLIPEMHDPLLNDPEVLQ